MRAKLLIAISAALLGLAGGWLLGHQPARDRAPETVATDPTPVPVMPPPRKLDPEWTKPALEAKVRAIPLSEIHGTTNQRPLKNSLMWGGVDYEDRWQRLQTRLDCGMTQTAFLVNSVTVYGAADRAAGLYNSKWDLDRIETTTEDGINKFWAFVYLGTWSDDPALWIDSVTLSDRELVVNYKSVFRVDSGRTSREHAYFIPLGEQTPGWFTIKLVYCGETYEPNLSKLITADELIEKVETRVIRTRLVEPRRWN